MANHVHTPSPKSHPVTIVTSRRIAVATALLALSGASAARAVEPALPDSDLIALAVEFCACDRAQRAIYDGPDAIADDDAAGIATSPIFARMDSLLDAMGDIRAVTAGGIQARAEALAQHSGEGAFSFDYPDSMSGRLLGYLMRDAAALSGRA